MNWNDLKDLDQQFSMQGIKDHPIAIDSGKGAMLYDLEGRSYLDFSSGKEGNTLGHGNSQWAEAIMDQTLKLGISSPLFYQAPCTRLTQELCLRTGMANALLTSSGKAANGWMASLARSYSAAKHSQDRSVILSIRTMAADSEESQTQAAFAEEGFRIVAADMEAIQNEAKGDVCAVMLELFQKDGSMEALPRQFVHSLAIFCAEQDWLLLLDETQTGAGRCGTLFAFQQYGILPDVLSFGEGMSGGLPGGGILASNRCRTVLDERMLARVPGANPICAAASLAVLDQLNENTLAQVKEKGDYLRSGIEALSLPCLQSPRGSGLMIAVPLAEEEEPDAIAARLADCGLLCQAIPGGLLFLPPLLVTVEEMDKALAILKQALGEGISP